MCVDSEGVAIIHASQATKHLHYASTGNRQKRVNCPLVASRLPHANGKEKPRQCDMKTRAGLWRDGYKSSTFD